MKKDKHGINMYNYVSREGAKGEIVIVRFERQNWKTEDLPILYAQYIQQATEIVSAALLVQKIGVDRWTRQAGLLLGKSAYAFRQADEIAFYLKKINQVKNETRDLLEEHQV